MLPPFDNERTLNDDFDNQELEVTQEQDPETSSEIESSAELAEEEEKQSKSLRMPVWDRFSSTCTISDRCLC